MATGSYAMLRIPTAALWNLDPRAFDWSTLGRVLWAHRLFLGCLALSVLALTSLHVSQVPPQYEAEALLLLGAPKHVAAPSAAPATSFRQEDPEREMLAFRSPAMAERLVEALRRAGEAAHERLWQLPLWPEHRESMRSEIADVKQTGGRDGGTITAAAFLSYFVGDTPWAHLDIAPTANVERAGPYQPAGATGVGVPLLVEFLRNWRAARLG